MGWSGLVAQLLPNTVHYPPIWSQCETRHEQKVCCKAQQSVFTNVSRSPPHPSHLPLISTPPHYNLTFTTLLCTQSLLLLQLQFAGLCFTPGFVYSPHMQRHYDRLIELSPSGLTYCLCTPHHTCASHRRKHTNAAAMTTLTSRGKQLQTYNVQINFLSEQF